MTGIVGGSVDLREAAKAVDDLFATRAAEVRAPSASYGVFDRHGLVHTGSTGSVRGVAPTPDTVYRIASCTKSFTATALLALRDAGALGLDDPVSAYVPAFSRVVLPTDDSPVPTLRMLLTMSAGLPTDDPWGDRQEAIGDADLDALLTRGLRFDSVPATRFAYSNLGYALLGRVIAEAAGRPYRTVVEETILAPLGLTDTTFTRPDHDRVAIGHRRHGDVWEPLPFSGPGAFSSIGGLFSTVSDLSQWARWLAAAFDYERVPDRAKSPDILSTASRRELQQAYRVVPALPVQPAGYGFGLFVEEQPLVGTVVSHSGGYPGFSAHMRWHPASGIGIVAFENATYAQVAAPASAALHGLLHDVGAAPVAAVWPEVLEARRVVEAALSGSPLPIGAVSPNVELDVPLDRRRVEWAAAMAAAGVALPLPARQAPGRPASTLPTDASGSPTSNVPIDVAGGERSSAPSHLVWRLTGAAGTVRVEIRLTPESPPRLQTLTVRPEPV